MSKIKPEDQGKALVAEIKASQKAKKALAKEPFTNKIHDFVYFVKFMVAFTFASAIVFCGVYAAYKGYRSTYALAHVGLIVAGAAAIAQGLTLVWKAVMRLEK